MRITPWLMTTAMALSAITMQGRQLSPSESLNMASGALCTQSTGVAPQSESAYNMILTVSGPRSGQPAVYVFDRREGGFLVTAADDAAGAVLLGYSDRGTFTLTPDVAWWLGQYASEVEISASESPAIDAAAPRRAPAVQRSEIAPLLKTLWNQDAPYNNECPYPANGGEVRCPTGCVATAMAQVMNYHRWPAKGKGSHQYDCTNVGQTLSFNFGDTTFDWPDMLDNYDGVDATDEQKKAVATLMYAVGVSIDMNYGPRGSGSNYFQGARALLEYFDYDKGMQVLEREYFPLEMWVAAIYDEIAAGRPVLYAGQNNEDGHAFVFDGYRTGDYFHVNWGWGGSSNGYFLVTALNPLVQGIGGSSSGYNLGQNVIIGLQPPVEGSQIVPAIRFVGGFTTNSEQYGRGEGAEVEFEDQQGIFNAAIDAITITPGVKLTDASGRESYVTATSPLALLYEQGVRGYVVPTSAFPTEGTYTVTPGFRDSSGQWHDARVAMGTQSSLTLRATADELLFTPDAVATVEATNVRLNTRLVVGCEFSLSATVTATQGEYYGQVMPVLMANGTAVAEATPIAVDLTKGDSVDYEWISTFGTSLIEGDYRLVLTTAQGNIVSQPLDVRVEPAPAEPAEAEASIAITNADGGMGYSSTPYEVPASGIDATVTVTGEAGYFAQTISGYVFYDGNTMVRSRTAGFMGVAAGETATLPLHIDLEGLQEGHTFILCPWSSESGQIGNAICFVIKSPAVIEGVERDADSITVSPNPMLDCVTVTAERPMGEVAIFSLGGTEATRVVLDGQNEATIDVAMLPAGLYLLEVVYTNGETAVRKVIKQ